jgi:hypothetical protein
MQQTSSLVRHSTPVVRGGKHVLALDDVSLEIDPMIGGRITGVYLGERNMLTGSEVDPGNFGSTFWTSPQSGWGWPPVPEIDDGPYEAVVDGDTIVLRSSPSRTLGVQVEKRFAADPRRGAFLLEFRIRNRGSEPARMAPWQITRVPPGGLSFFPSPSFEGAYPPSNLAVREELGITWYAYDAAAVTDHQKLFADGREGWLAHVDGDALLLKTFAVVPRDRQAPGEAQIEIYATPAHTYVEVEVQGAYETIAPGAASTWSVVWLVRHLPPDLPRAAGSPQLAAYIRSLVRDATAAR